MTKTKNILLGHGSGGKLSHDLISELFVKYFQNEILSQQTDSALLSLSLKDIAFTTDAYVVDPLFFPGGNIGKLSVCGTINDLSVSGAVPKYISASFIIEEGFSIEELESIVKAMAEEAVKSGVLIVTGDTKVVNKGKCDKIFITTSGIGEIDEKYKSISSGTRIKTGDQIIINGSIGDHGIAILAARESLNFETPVLSDCASLNGIIRNILESGVNVKFMRDATRGGLATVLCEVSEKTNTGIELIETSIHVKEAVKGVCELFGFDPLYLANEGKFVIIVAAEDAEKTISILKNDFLGKESTIIGEIVTNHKGIVAMKTEIGGSRIVDMPAGEMLPRIC